MTTVEEDTVFQYLDGWDLLSAALMERTQMLRELEQLIQAPQNSSSMEEVAKFSLVSAQALLFELSIIGENIETLIGEINRYAERCGKPRVQMLEMELR
jgi:hypothetical protein